MRLDGSLSDLIGSVLWVCEDLNVLLAIGTCEVKGVDGCGVIVSLLFLLSIESFASV